MADRTALIDRNDDRRRYEHQAYDVTFGGLSKETGRLGYFSRLPATYDAVFQVAIDVADQTPGDPVQAIIPPYVCVHSYSVLIAAEGGGAGSIMDVSIADADGGNAVLFADDARINQLAAPTNGASVIGATNAERLVSVAVTPAAATGIMVLGLHASIVATEWK